MALKYSDLVPAPKMAVRFDTLCGMIENAKLAKKLIDKGWLKPIDPKESVPLYDMGDIAKAWSQYRLECQGVRA